LSTGILPNTFTAQHRRANVTPGDAQSPDGSRLARFLGWFSIGLGLSEMVAPGAISRTAGARDHKKLVRLYGMREMAAGVGILAQPKQPKWLWARVAGDVVDIASIIRGSQKRKRKATAGTLAAVAGVTALDVVCATRCSRETETAQAERAESSLLINRSPEECYRFWRNVENFPRFVSEIKSVRVTGDKTSHWTARLPRQSGSIEWDAEIIEDVPNQRISWRSQPRDGVSVNGTVTFEPAPGGRGTIIRVQLEYDQPGRSIAAPAARLIGKHPEQITHKSLYRLRQLMELGEILTTEGQSAGRRGGTTWLDSMAR
jgi:uncharacterized membrane protein